MNSSVWQTVVPSASYRTACAVLLAGFLVLAAQAASIAKRGPGESSEDTECPGRQPCGWLVYNKSSRNTEFFMNNTCICAAEKTCLQTDDDLSVGAYVFRCILRKDINPSLIPS